MLTNLFPVFSQGESHWAETCEWMAGAPLRAHLCSQPQRRLWAGRRWDEGQGLPMPCRRGTGGLPSATWRPLLPYSLDEASGRVAGVFCRGQVEICDV